MARHGMGQLIAQGLLLAAIGGMTACATVNGQDATEGEAATVPDSLSLDLRISDSPPVWGDREEVLFRIMAGEVSAHRGDYLAAAEHYVAAARLGNHAELAERATRVAAFAQHREAALEAAELWVALDPAAMEGRQVLAVLLVGEGRTDEAVEHLEHVLEAHGNLGDGFQEIAQMLAAEGQDVTSSLEALEELAETRQDATGFTALARFAVSVGEFDIAVDAAERADELAESQASADLLAGILTRARGPEAAADYMSERLATEPDAPRLRRVQAQLLSETGDFDQALEHFSWLERHDPDDPEVTFSAGLLALQQGDASAAEERLARLLEHEERGHEAAFYYARVAEEQGDYAEALERYRAVGEGRYEADARLREGMVLAEVEGLDAGREHLRTWGRRYPDQQIVFYQAEAEMLREQGQYEGALRIYDEALDAFGEDEDLLYARALTAERLDRLNEVEADLRRILEMDPDHAHALNALGYTLADRTERYEEAERYISRALELMPESFYVLDSMGWVQYRKGNHEKALEYLERAWELSDHDPEVGAHLGEVLWVMGRRDEAREVWDKAREQDPQHEVLRETMERFNG